MASLHSAEHQRDAIKAVRPSEHVSLVAGESYCLLPTSWWKIWAAHVGWDGPSSGFAPDPIDTDPLLAEAKDGAPRQLQSMTEGEAWMLVTKETWDLLVGWYGGGPVIERPAVEAGGVAGRPKEVQLELMLMHFTVHIETADAAIKARAEAAPLVLCMSKAQRVGKCLGNICEAWELPPDKVRLWDFYNQQRYNLLGDAEATLASVPLYSGQDVLVEHQNADGAWPFADDSAESGASMDLFDGIGSTTSTSSATPATGTAVGPSARSTSFGAGSSSSGRQDTVVDTSTPQQHGVVGLSNLGNTCFMNSMLQCLSNLKPLRSFFLDGSFQSDLNEKNPLGTEGELAAAFASLLKLVWGNGASVISPRSFKAILGKHAPQFSGYSQHDSQELCNYVLDKLHEDVNRVLTKPYVENFEADGEPDAEIIAEVQKRHRMRNSSRIGDMFQGYYKSKVVCPECQRVSVTFDPYMSVTLPLGAQDNSRGLVVSLRTLGGALSKLSLTLNASGKIEALLAAVSKQVTIPVTRLVAAELYNGRFHKFFDNGDALERLYDNDIVFVYETQHARVFASQQVAESAAADAGSSAAHEAAAAEPEALCGIALLQKEAKTRNVGLPLVLTAPSSVSAAQLYELIGAQLEKYRAAGGGAAEASDAEGTGGAASADGRAGSAMDVEPRCESAMDVDTPTSASTSAEPPIIVSGVPVVEPDAGSSSGGGSSGGAVIGDIVSIDGEPASPAPLWTLHLARSDWDPPGDPLPRDGASAVWTAPSTGRDPRTLLLVWSDAAFDAAGGYDRQKLVDDSSDKTAVGCGKKLSPAGGGKESSMTLHKCFELFQKEETLDADNLWYCSKCKDFRQASKQMQLWSLPPILVIHLKRFSAQGGWRRKLDTPVDFPIDNVDLTQYALCHEPGNGSEDERDIYDLVAVSNHFGSTGGGHYTAFAKNSDSRCWYKFDDSHTSYVPDPATVVTPAAYVLMYVKRSCADKID